MTSTARTLKEQKSLLLSEFYKLLRLRSLYLLLLLLLLFVVSLMIVTFNTDLDHLLYQFGRSGFKNKWMFIYSTLELVSILIFPFIVGLLVICMTYMENVANGYSLLKRAPYSMLNIDVAKILVIFITGILIFFLVHIFTILYTELFALLRPDFGLSYANRKHVFLLAYMLDGIPYILTLALLFFLISTRVKNLPALVSIIFLSPLLSVVIIPDAANPFLFLDLNNELNFDGTELSNMSLHSPFVIKFSQINVIYIVAMSGLLYWFRARAK